MFVSRKSSDKVPKSYRAAVDPMNDSLEINEDLCLMKVKRERGLMVSLKITD